MLEIYRKTDLEEKLSFLIKCGKTREEAVTILMDEEKEIDANYIIEAYLMPLDEITREIEKYDSSNPKLDELKFINELCEKYHVDRKAIVERIRNVRKINKQKKYDTPERLERLKKRRDYLQKEKDKLSNKSMNFEEKTMFYYGLTVTTIVGGILFYSSSPLLVGIIPVVYAAGFPMLRLNAINKAEIRYVNELVDIGKEIKFLEERLNSDKEYVFENTKDENTKAQEVRCIYDNMPKNISKDKTLVKKL